MRVLRASARRGGADTFACHSNSILSTISRPNASRRSRRLGLGSVPDEPDGEAFAVTAPLDKCHNLLDDLGRVCCLLTAERPTSTKPVSTAHPAVSE
jgi:hypothetical protein